MREIKFRAWDFGQFPKMEYDVTISTGKDWSCFDDREIIGRAIMQYTGLKDETGKEIYEGDIITAVIVPAQSVPTMGEVVFDVEHLCYGNKNLSGITPFYNLKDCKVIGDIYKNKELLKC